MRTRSAPASRLRAHRFLHQGESEGDIGCRLEFDLDPVRGPPSSVDPRVEPALALPKPQPLSTQTNVQSSFTVEVGNLSVPDSIRRADTEAGPGGAKSG